MSAFGKKRVRPVLQSTTVECGASCLAMISDYHGKSLSLEEINEKIKPGRSGTSASEMVNYARELGFRVKAYSVEPVDIKNLLLPAIIHWGFNHFVILEKYTRKSITLVDPARGRVEVTPHEFDEKFTGILITFTPETNFKKIGREGFLGKWKAYLSTFTANKDVKKSLKRVLVVSLIIQVFGLILPFVTKLVIDDVLPLDLVSIMPVLGIGILVLILSRFFLNYLRSTLLLQLQIQFDSLMTAGVLSYLLTLP